MGFGVLWGFRNHQFLSMTCYSPAIVLLSLGMTVFWPVWAQIAAGEAQDRAGGAEPPSLQPLRPMKVVTMADEDNDVYCVTTLASGL